MSATSAGAALQQKAELSLMLSDCTIADLTGTVDCFPLFTQQMDELLLTHDLMIHKGGDTAHYEIRHVLGSPFFFFYICESHSLLGSWPCASWLLSQALATSSRVMMKTKWDRRSLSEGQRSSGGQWGDRAEGSGRLQCLCRGITGGQKCAVVLAVTSTATRGCKYPVFSIVQKFVQKVERSKQTLLEKFILKVHREC